MGDLGIGSATQYDVLEIKKDMTVGELIAHLQTFPPTGKLCLFEALASSKYAQQSIDKSKMRVPIVVSAGGRMSQLTTEENTNGN